MTPSDAKNLKDYIQQCVEIADTQLEQAHNRIKTLEELGRYHGQMLYFVAVEYRTEGKDIQFSGKTRLFQMRADYFLKKNGESRYSEGYKHFIPTFDKDITDPVYVTAHGRDISLNDQQVWWEAVCVRQFNVPYTPMAKDRHNAAFATLEDAERYRLWLLMVRGTDNFMGLSSQTAKRVMGVHTLPRNKIRVRNRPRE